MTEIEVDNPERFAELAEIARRVGDDDDVVPVLFDALEQYIDEAEAQHKRVAEARDRTRERLELDDGDSTSRNGSEHTRPAEAADDDVAQKQAELREKHFN